MSRFPAVTGKQMIRALERVGFEVKRQRGSHRFVSHPDGRTTVVAVHAGETLGPGLLAKILRDVQISREEFQKLL